MSLAFKARQKIDLVVGDNQVVAPDYLEQLDQFFVVMQRQETLSKTCLV